MISRINNLLLIYLFVRYIINLGNLTILKSPDHACFGTSQFYIREEFQLSQNGSRLLACHIKRLKE